MRSRSARIFWVVAGLLLLAPPLCLHAPDEAGAETPRPAPPAGGELLPKTGTPVKGAVSEAAALELKRQQLAAREAALAVKEQELKNLSATLEARVKELEAAKSGIDKTLDARKKVQSANYQKLLKVYKALKPQDAAKFVDKLDEHEALELLGEMDQKRLAKLLPLLKQERVVKWTRLNMVATR